MAKISWRAAELLIMIGDHCEDGLYWVPPSGLKESWSDTLGRPVFIDGSGIASALRALYRRGLLKEKTLARYASEITEEGRKLIEHWRETDTWPVERKA